MLIVQWAWFGDIGYKCRASWFESKCKVGSGIYTPKCIWLDKDHTNGIRHQGISIHKPDFSSDTGRIKQYNDLPDTICKSEPRLKLWGDIWSDYMVLFFNPPLVYTRDGGGKNVEKVLYPHRKRSLAFHCRLGKRQSNTRSDHLIISNLDGHSAKNLYRSDSSLGPDFVALRESLYCDMSAKEAWPLCSETFTTGCFDLETNALQGGTSIGVQHRDAVTGRIIPEKMYKTTEQWD